VLALVLLACGGTPRRSSEPASPNAFVVGGVPRHDAALGAAFEALPAIPVEGSFDVFAGSALAEALPRLWAAALAWDRGDVDSAPVRDLAVELNTELRAEGLGYFVMPLLEETGAGRRASLRTFIVREVVLARVDGADDIAALVLEPLSGTAIDDSGGVTFRGTPLVFAHKARADAVNLLEGVAHRRMVLFEHAVELGTNLNRLLLDEIGRTPTLAELEPRLVRRLVLHEVQHALDYQAERFEPYAPLVEAMGSVDDRGQVLATMELSAWTATLVRELSWWDVLSALLNAHQVDDDGFLPTAYANAFLIDALALGLDANARPSLRDGVIDRTQLHANAVVLTKQSSEQIARVARASWESWFGTTLQSVALVP
jgi:hypothetical protein